MCSLIYHWLKSCINYNNYDLKSIKKKLIFTNLFFNKMASIEKIEEDKRKAEGWYEEAKNNLDEFMKEENAKKFKELWGMEGMIEEKKRLEAEKKRWGDQVVKLQDA